MHAACSRFRHIVLTALAVLSIPAATRADLINYEPFSYAPAGADLLGANGGQGWSGPWAAGGFNASISNNFDLAAGSLAKDRLLTAGNRTTTLAQNAISGLVRSFDQPIGAGDTLTRYLSVLLRPEGTLHVGQFNGFFGLYLDGIGPNGDDVFIGKGGGGQLDRWVVETRGGSGQFASSVAPVINETTLLVLKSQFTAGLELFTLYVNPTPGEPEPTSGVLKNDLDLGGVSGIALYSTGAFSVDEIRWGQTFADVTPVPEPATWMLAAIVSLLWFLLAPKRVSGAADVVAH